MMHVPRSVSSCESPTPTDTLTDRLNTLLNSSGVGYTLSLCPSEQYYITSPLLFAAPDQEISTAGYPTDDTRATLVVSGTNQTTAVNGQCKNCDGVKLRNVQINGTRLGGPSIPRGGANIEMGGSNADQLVEFVHSFDPRGWSCLHISEGNLNCTNATVQNNDLGPAGSDLFQQWADGISIACRNSVVRNNMINNPTDGGIVLFGSPGTRVENNTIWVNKHTLLGGINMVDISPFGGDYSGVVVTENIIAGGFASQVAHGSEMKGTNDNNVIIKVGIAIGPRVWFGSKFGNNVSTGGMVQNNQLTGAFSYGIGISAATNFTVENNFLVGNTSFIGTRGPNCTANVPTPSPAPLVIDESTVRASYTQTNFTSVSSGDKLICVFPPAGGEYWPFGGNPNSTDAPISPPEALTSATASPSSLSAGKTAGIVIGTLIALLTLATATWYVRKWAVKKWSETAMPLYPSRFRDSAGYIKFRQN